MMETNYNKKNMSVISLFFAALLFFAVSGLFLNQKTVAAKEIGLIEVNNFVMTDAAELCSMSATNNGLKFSAILDKTSYEALEAKETDAIKVYYGMLIVPNDYITECYELTVENVFGGGTGKYGYYFSDIPEEEKTELETNGKKQIIRLQTDSLTQKNENGDYIISGSIKNIIKTNLTRQFTGLAYIYYQDGESYDVIFADYYNGEQQNNTCSMSFLVQKLAEEQEVSQDFLDAFVDNELEFAYYVVHHYQSNSVDVETEKVTCYGKLSEEVTAQLKNKSGYKFSEESTNLSAKVYANGKTVIDVYYESNAVNTEEVRNISLYSYDNDAGEISAKPTTEFDLDLTKYSSQITGTPVSVKNSTWGYDCDCDISYNNGVVTLSADALTDNSMQRTGDNTFVISFEDNGEETCTVVVNTFVATFVIKDANDLDAFGAIADAADGTVGNGVWDGYFVLANDIEYNKEFTPFITRQSLKRATGWKDNSVWVDPVKYGFKGTFDGLGHNIEGLKIVGTATAEFDNGYGTKFQDPQTGGFIGLLNNNGIIRNVSFTKAELTGAGTQGWGFIAYCANGTMQNIYVSYAKLENTGTGRVGTFVGLTAQAAGLKIKNSFVNVLDATITGSNIYAIGSVHTHYGCVNNVYVVGTTDDVIYSLSVQSGSEDVYGVYADYDELQQSGVDFASVYTDDFWDVRNGIPCPKNFDYLTITEAINLDTVIHAEVSRGEDNVTVSLENDVAQDFAAASTIVVKDGNTEISGASLSGKSIIIPKSSLTNIYGNHELTIFIDEDAGNGIVKSYKVTCTVIKSTMAIKTAEDLDGFGEVADEFDGTVGNGVWDGYFVLANDIEYNKEFTPFITRQSLKRATGWKDYGVWTDPVNYGFKGTFDGLGHNIEGLKIVGTATAEFDNGYGTKFQDPQTGGFIGLLNNNGIIRNVSFTKAELTGAGTQGWGFIAYCANGRMQNIYVSYAKLENTGTGRVGTFVGLDARAALRVKNCVVDLTSATVSGSNIYAVGSSHLGYGCVNNVYVVGTTSEIVRAISGTKGADDVYEAYATVQDFANAEIPLDATNGWAMDYWTKDANGMFVFK